jgi:rod shape-determining protein MreC
MVAILYRLRSIISLIVCVIVSIWLSNRSLDSKFALARGLQITVLAPVQTIIARITSLRNLIAEVEYLRERTGMLMFENSSMQQAIRENRELRNMLDYTNNTSIKLIPAEVIAMKRDGITSYVIIKAGTREGVERNFPVATVNGVAGKIIEVYPFHSIVRLIDDPASKTGVRLKKIGEPSIMDCPDGKMGRITFQEHLNVNTGDTIVTSGLGGLFPKGLFVGTVSYIEENGELLKTARIKFHDGLRNMEHSLIMKIETMWMPFPEE